MKQAMKTIEREEERAKNMVSHGLDIKLDVPDVPDETDEGCRRMGHERDIRSK
jgi:hypothetical protein